MKSWDWSLWWMSVTEVGVAGQVGVGVAGEEQPRVGEKVGKGERLWQIGAEDGRAGD